MQMIYSIFFLFTVIFLCPCTRPMAFVLNDFVYTTGSVWTASLAFLHLESFVWSSSHGVLQRSVVYIDRGWVVFLTVGSMTFSQGGTRFFINGNVAFLWEQFLFIWILFSWWSLHKTSSLDLVPSLFSDLRLLDRSYLRLDGFSVNEVYFLVCRIFTSSTKVSGFVTLSYVVFLFGMTSNFKGKERAFLQLFGTGRLCLCQFSTTE